ncbi:MAG: hypothetical protein ABIU05_03830 [Nitrospirales bacterium]
MWPRILLVLVCVSGALVGCAKDPILITAENRSLLKSPPFYSAHGTIPKLYYASRGEKTTAFLGGLLFSVLFLPVAMAMENSHDDLVELYHLENPSLTIEQDLARRIVKEDDLKDIRPNEVGGSWSDPDDLKRRFSQGLLLEVRSDQWGLQPTSWSQFHVVLKSSSRLVSVQDAKEIWYDTCVSEKIDGGERDPNLEDLKAKDGELLKTMVKEATETCTAELWKKLQMVAIPK